MVELTRSACRSSQRKTPRPAACECSSSLRPAARRHWLESPGRCRRGQWPPWRTQLGTDALWRIWGGSLEDVSNWASRSWLLLCIAMKHMRSIILLHQFYLPVRRWSSVNHIDETEKKNNKKKRVLFSKWWRIFYNFHLQKYAQLFSLIAKQYLIEVFNIKEIHEHLFF